MGIIYTRRKYKGSHRGALGASTPPLSSFLLGFGCVPYFTFGENSSWALYDSADDCNLCLGVLLLAMGGKFTDRETEGADWMTRNCRAGIAFW